MTTDPVSERQKRIAARKEALKARMPARVPTVHVEPARDDIRKYLKHPGGHVFPESGSAEWPLDRFTRRRIADGSVTVAEHAGSVRQHHPRPPRAE